MLAGHVNTVDTKDYSILKEWQFRMIGWKLKSILAAIH